MKQMKYALLLVMLFLLTGCDKPVILHTGINESDANEMLSELSKYRIDARKQMDKNGVAVLVNQTDLDRSVQILNARGLPHRSRTNMGEVFQKNGIISSPMEERARYIYALSQEVESTLAQIDGVVVARVHVVLPERVAPGEPVQPASAAVFIKYLNNLDPDSIEPRIRRLVTTSIPGLNGKGPDAVSVVFVPGEAYQDRREFVTLGPFILTTEEYGTVKTLFFSLCGVLMLLVPLFLMRSKLLSALPSRKAAALNNTREI